MCRCLYPKGICPPQLLLNSNGTRRTGAYGKRFLLQFRNLVKERPAGEWDHEIKASLAAKPAAARVGTAAWAIAKKGGVYQKAYDHLSEACTQFFLLRQHQHYQAVLHVIEDIFGKSA